MNIYGLTPIDAALSFLGLNFCHNVAYLIFSQTKIAVCGFIMAMLWGVWHLAATGNFRPLIMLFICVISISFLLLPSREERDIKSAQELYGQATFSSQRLKDQIAAANTVPIIFTYLTQFADSIVVAVIRALDFNFPQQLRFINAPFQIYADVIHVGDSVRHGVGDPVLSERVDRFLFDQYVPAIRIFEQKKGLRASQLPVTLWPGDDRVRSYMPQEANEEWASLYQALKTYLDRHPDFSRARLMSLTALTGVPDASLTDLLVKAIIHEHLRKAVGMRTQNHIWQGSLMILTVIFPWVLGFSNMLLYIFLPFIILAFAVRQRSDVLLHYAGIFLWIKSWVIGWALCFYASLLFALMQRQSNELAWAWERPYYIAAAALMLILMPALTFVLIKRGGTRWGAR